MGSSPYALTELMRCILECGRAGGVLQPLTNPAQLQSDQENAIKVLVRDCAAITGMSVRHSRVYTSQAQGNVERWHQTLWSHIRTLKTSILKNYGIKLPVDSPLINWTCKHASWLQNRFQLHDDGKTSYERR